MRFKVLQVDLTRCGAILGVMAAGGVLAAGLGIIGSQPVRADSVPTPIRQVQLPNGMPLTEYRLPNGLTVYVIENHSAPVFTYQTWFHVGSRDEKLDPRIGTTGLAHLFEHMMFRGTPKYPDGQFDSTLAQNGVNDENATTWFDRTNYYESLPSAQLSLVMQLESDRMANLTVDQSLLTTEASAVVGEYNMGQDDPDTVAYDTLYATAYTVHPYKYPVIGVPSDIQKFSVAEAQYFYETYYSPSNATIMVVGDVTPTNVAALAQQYYGGYAAHAIPHETVPAEPVQTAERDASFAHPQLQQTRVLIGYHIPAVTNPDIPALLVLQSALTYGQSSLLELNWVNTGLSVSVRGEVNQFEDPGLFTIETDLQPGSLAANVPGQLDQALATISSDTAGSYLSRAVNQALLRINSQLEENGSLASYLGEYIETAGDPVFGFNQVSQIQAVTAADVARVIKTYLQPSNRTVVIGNPESGT